MKKSWIDKAAAWGVHLLTASGILLGALAILAIAAGDGRGALMLLLVAFVIDGLDGPLARAARVREVLPNINGEILDLVVDYVTYVFVPVAFIYKFDLLPQAVSGAGCAAILLTSLYLFSKRDMKSDDLFFVGFPSIWNLIVLYMFVLGTAPMLNATIVGVLSGLTFVPLKFVHPVRVRLLRALTMVMTLAWLILAFSLLYVHPETSATLEVAWIGAGLYFILLSGWRTCFGASEPQSQDPA